ncbi:MAG TPA: class I SAM-dependent methyltransferase [Candidatus Nitrosotenuis sp.]|jgi:SAM-dependent methyltransferase|nr:class I SAM-dependent methyltransferase [Candidatus Nitrosotenuis sp.]
MKAHIGQTALSVARIRKHHFCQDDNQLIPTLNRQGYMLTTLHEYSQAFIDFAPEAPGPLLDIGTAYGFNALAALNKGSYIIANDLDPRHLTILKQCIPASLKSRIELRPGRIPGEVTFSSQSLGGVLASGVFQFLSGEELVQAVADIYDWLKPGGKFFFASSTPYCKAFTAFRPIYEENKRLGRSWPGFIEDTSIYLPHICNEIPQLMNLIDEDIMEALLTQTGFYVEKLGLFNIPCVARGVKSDADEILGGIAIKR